MKKIDLLLARYREEFLPIAAVGYGVGFGFLLCSLIAVGLEGPTKKSADWYNFGIAGCLAGTVATSLAGRGYAVNKRLWGGR